MIPPNGHRTSSRDRGFALIGVLILVGVVSVATLILPSYFNQTMQVQKTAGVRYAATMIKEDLMAALDNDAVWFATITNNPNLQCLRTDGATCAATDFGPITVYDADGTVSVDQAPNTGIDLSGRPCVGFDPVNGHESCVLRFQVSWQCVGACGVTSIPPSFVISPTVKVRLNAQVLYSPRNRAHVNDIDTASTKYTFNFIRGSKSKTLSSFCNSIGGTFNQQSSLCLNVGTASSFDCTVIAGPSTWFVGFAPDGTPKCMNDPKVNVRCPSGTAVVGYNIRGGLACGPF